MTHFIDELLNQGFRGPELQSKIIEKLEEHLGRGSCEEKKSTEVEVIVGEGMFLLETE
jgi:hypothetical protein